MSLITYATENAGSRAPSVRLPEIDGEPIMLIVDVGREPERLAMHTIPGKGKRRCIGEGCPQCAAELSVTVKHVLSVDQTDADGIVHDRRLWLFDSELRALADALRVAGAVSGTVELEVSCVADPKAKSTRKDGTPWGMLIFAVVDGETIEDDGR